MSETSPAHDRRAMYVAGVGFVLQLAAFGALLALAQWSTSDTLATVSRFFLIGLPIWLVLFLFFKQLRRVTVEALETAELKRARAEGVSEAIFELDDEALLIEQNRLRWMIRWLFPVTTLVLAVLLVGGHFLGWTWTFEDAFKLRGETALNRTDRPTLMMWFVVGMGFLCFLYARYGLALSRIPEWRLLRAGAICMAGNAVVCLALAIALMSASTIEWAEPLLAYLIRGLLLLLGLEFLAHLILDYYRPRSPDIIPRPSFESRMLSLISEPGSIAKSIAEAINYQFGFEVSSTWFYQLLQRWIFPLMVATCIVVLALTSVVIVDAEEMAVVERFGRLRSEEPLGPGVHFKLPFPVEIVRRAPVSRISELVIGEALAEETEIDRRKAILWTEAHDYLPELMLLVASPQTGEESLGRQEVDQASATTAGKSVPVHLLLVSVPIEYRIKDIKQYLYNHEEPIRLLEGVAYRYVSDFAASVDANTLMGPQREEFNSRLKELIQGTLDELEAGIEIVFVGIRGVHPPARQDVAKTYHASIAAQTNSKATIHAAESEERRMLTAAAGSVVRARELDDAIRHRNSLRALPKPDPVALAAAEAKVTDLLMGNPENEVEPPSGEVAAVVSRARAQSSRDISDAAAKVRLFNAELAAYTAAPELYLKRRELEALEELDRVRKFLIVGDSDNVIIEHDTAEEGALDRVLEDAASGK